MNKKWLIICGLLIAAAIGTFLPQFIVDQAEGSPGEVTYRFEALGMTTTESANQIEEILQNVLGVSDIHVNPASDQVTVTFDQETMKPEWIVKSLEANGFSPGKYSKLKNRK